MHLSLDVPAKTEEQNLVSEINSTTTISSGSPTALNQPSNSMATVKQSTFISCGKNFISNFKCGNASFLEGANSLENYRSTVVQSVNFFTSVYELCSNDNSSVLKQLMYPVYK